MRDRTPEENRKLIEKYPFLIPRNRWSGKVPEDYDYSYTELDIAEMSDAWVDKLLMPMLEEIRKELVRAEKKREETPEERRKFAKWYCSDCGKDHDDYLHVWHILQAKEKYGTLRLYSTFEPGKVRKIIAKYERMSERTCYFCGKSADIISQGYILPYCKKCAKEHKVESYIPIDEWLNGEE